MHESVKKVINYDGLTLSGVNYAVFLLSLGDCDDSLFDDEMSELVWDPSESLGFRDIDSSQMDQVLDDEVFTAFG